MKHDVEKTLKERGNRYNTYGSYTDHATLCQAMKEAMRRHAGWDEKPPEVQESLDMLAHKMARVVNGDHYYIDNWADIEGYSRLVIKSIEGE